MIGSAIALGRRYWPIVAVAALLVGLFFVGRAYIADVASDARAAQLAIDQRVIDQLKADVKTKTAEAKAADEAHARAVEAAQHDISNGVSHDLQTQLAAVRARYSELLAQAPRAGEGGGGNANLPGIPDAPRRCDDPARDDRLLGLALEADENTAKLIALQRWLAEQQAVRR